MKIVDEPASHVETQLQEQQVAVHREPYDPKSRSLLQDFVGFLRTPEAGSTVTLFEDENGRVRYYTVTRVDPQVEALRTRVQELSQHGLPTEQLDRIEAKLARVDALEARLVQVDELATRVERLPELEEKVARLPEIEEKVARLPEIEAAVAKVPELEATVAKVPELETKVQQIGTLQTRITRLEQPR